MTAQTYSATEKVVLIVVVVAGLGYFLLTLIRKSQFNSMSLLMNVNGIELIWEITP